MDKEETSLLSATNLTINSANVGTQANSFNAAIESLTLTDAKDVYLTEKDNLSIAKANAQSMTLNAKDVTISGLTSVTNSLNVQAADLVVNGAMASGGGVTLNANSVTLNSDVMTTSGEIKIVATTGAITQNANLKSNTGNIIVKAENGSVVMAQNVVTSTTDADVIYKAKSDLGISIIHTNSGNVELSVFKDGHIRDVNHDNLSNVTAKRLNVIGRGSEYYGQALQGENFADIFKETIEVNAAVIYTAIPQEVVSPTLKYTEGDLPILGIFGYEDAEHWSLQFVSLERPIGSTTHIIFNQEEQTERYQEIYQWLPIYEIIPTIESKADATTPFNGASLHFGVRAGSEIMKTQETNGDSFLEFATLKFESRGLLDMNPVNNQDFNMFRVIPRFNLSSANSNLFFEEEFVFEYWIEEIAL